MTRARSQSSELSRLLREQASEVLEVPVISLEPLDDYTALDRAIDQLEEYAWLIFTSTNTVSFFFDRLHARSRDARAIRGRICAIGASTAAALSDRGLRVDLQPEEAVSESVAAAFEKFPVKDARILLPRAASAREVIPDALRSMGATLDVVDVYRNVVPAGAAEHAREVFESSPKPDWVVFTSSSTVKNLLSMVGRDALEGVRVASIGAITSKTVRMHGLRVEAEAAEASMRALAGAIIAACSADYQI